MKEVNSLTGGGGSLTDESVQEKIEKAESVETVSEQIDGEAEVAVSAVVGANAEQETLSVLNVSVVKAETKRFESLDLLRLISMWFIVCIHYIGWGGAASASEIPLLNYALSGGIAVGCNCAVNCFYLISGFFISKNENLSRSKGKILKVWTPTFIYSVLIPLLLLLIGKASFGGKQIVGFFFPVMTNQYWFSTVFIIMTALLPFIAKLLHNLDNKMLIVFMAILIFVDSIQPLGVNAFANIGYGLIHALTMYVIGFTIRRTDFKIKKIWCALVFVGCVGFIALVTVLSIRFTGDRNRTIADYNSLIVIVQAVALFLFFLQCKVTWKFSRIAPYVFGVYLLHENQWARTFLWDTLLQTPKYHSSNLMIVHWLLSTVIIVGIALFIEFLRISLGKCVIKLLKKMFKKKDKINE